MISIYAVTLVDANLTKLAPVGVGTITVKPSRTESNSVSITVNITGSTPLKVTLPGTSYTCGGATTIVAGQDSGGTVTQLIFTTASLKVAGLFALSNGGPSGYIAGAGA